MKKINRRNSGSILLETLLSLNIHVLILSGMAVLFLSMLHSYMQNLYQMELRTQMRFVAECMVQDIRYADTITVYQEGDYDAIILTTMAAGRYKPEFIKYYQDNMGFYPRIIKKGQPMTGNDAFCSTYVRFTCRPLSEDADNRVYLLQLKGLHQFSSQYFYLETAVTRLGSRILMKGINE